MFVAILSYLFKTLTNSSIKTLAMSDGSQSLTYAIIAL